MKGAELDRLTHGATNGMAGLGVTMPIWEQHLQHFGSVAQSLVPILSALWLAVQIVAYIRKRVFK